MIHFLLVWLPPSRGGTLVPFDLGDVIARKDFCAAKFKSPALA